MITYSDSNADRVAGDDGPAGLLVDAEWIAEHLEDPDVRLVEVDVSPAAYDSGHIPGAVLWNAYTDLRHADYTPIDAAELEAVLSRSGISRQSTIVLYGYGAYLGFWLMKCYRHDRVLMMDGPRERWARAGYQWSVEPALITGSSYPLPAADRALIASREVVEELIGQPDALVVDARSEAEFVGLCFWPSGATEDAGRAGHIPAAVHIPCDLVRDKDGALRSPEELRTLFDASGVGSDRRVLTYCTIGNRASQVWFALKYVLGHHDVSVYYGSWAEWGKLAATPIET
ncbi:MAG: sulfurtransferase [Actinomycetota bacterium]|nr:sulfurtransferase [Actinomycetota bacterium]